MCAHWSNCLILTATDAENMEITFIASNDAIYILIMLNLIRLYAANPPNIDYSNNMRILKLPKNLKPGTIVYRLKGTDADNDDIEFGVRGPIANTLLGIKKVSFHEADVYLKSRLEEYEYNITVYATDSKEFTEVESTIIATEAVENATTLSPFIVEEYLFKIFENATKNSTAASIIAKDKESSNLPVTFELRGSDKFSIRYVFGPRGTSKADIVLNNEVDYEKQNLYVLTIVALNAWTNESLDTRNIALIDLLVVIEDIQDSPPVFLNLPTVVRIAENTKIGSVIFRVSAEDGDHGNKRNITYSIDNSDSQMQTYFSVNEITGDIILTQPIQNIKSHYGTTEPIVLTVKATELTENKDNIELFTSISDIALVIISTVNKPPHFKNKHLIGTIDENSQIMTPVRWEGMSVPQVFDDDPGLNGTIVLEIDDPYNTFMIQPIKGINDLSFSVIVRDNQKLDFETSLEKQFNLIISATDQSIQESLTTKILCTIKLNDLNDNIPQFSKRVYEASILEDAEPGVTVAKIEATDVDSGEFGQIRFTSINGPIAKNLKLDAETGIIVLQSNEDIDREMIPEYTITIEARDQLGRGNKNVTELRIKLIDSNDNIPTFLQSRYDAILRPDRSNFTQPLVVKALDADEPNTVNSNVTYEIINGNYQDKFYIDSVSGEIVLKSPLTMETKFQTATQLFFGNESGDKFMPEFVLTVRAHDQGIPYRWSSVHVHIYNPDFLNRSVVFIFDETIDKVKQNLDSIEDGLGMITGANVYIPHDSIRTQRNRTIVNAWIAYPTQSIIDLSKLPIIYTKIRGKEYEILDKNTKNTKESENIKTGQLVTSDFQTLFWLLIILVLITLLFLIVFIFFWCCCCRNDQRRLKLNQQSDKTTTHRENISTVNGSVIKERDSTRDNELNNSVNKTKRDVCDVALRALNEESDTRSIYRPSSAPHSQPNHNQNFKANSFHAYPDSGSMYQRFKKRRNQRIRVSPEYYYEDDTPYDEQNEAILLNKLYQNPGYATVRHPTYFMQSRFDRNRLYKDDAAVGYVPNNAQFAAESYLAANVPEYRGSMRSNRPKASHLRYADKFATTTPKRSEILYIQTPITNQHIESNGQIDSHNNPSLDSLEYPKTVDGYSLNKNNAKEEERVQALRKQRHVSFHTRNTSDDNLQSDDTQHDVVQPINHTVFTNSNEKLKSNLTPVETITDLYAYNTQKEYNTSSSDEFRENGRDSRVQNQFSKKGLPHKTSKKQSEKLAQSSGILKNSDTNSDTQSADIETAHKAESNTSIEAKKSKKCAKNLIDFNRKSKTRLKKQNSSDNSEKSYDSDSGIGHSAITSNPNLDMKNSALMEKKSVFTIAYNDVKTRHLQSAESTNELIN